MIRFAGRLPSAQCEIFVGLIAGAPNRVAEAMAYGHRDARYVMNVHARWDDRADDELGIGWARQFFSAAAPYASAGAYVNFMTEEESSRVAAAYGGNYPRLVEPKRSPERAHSEVLDHMKEKLGAEAFVVIGSGGVLPITA